MIQSSKSERIAWYFYDWANSAFYTTVVTVFLGPYLTSVANNAADPSGYVSVLGIPVYAESFFTYCVSLSVILQVLILPLVGSIADVTGRKKLLLGLTAYIGAISATSLYFLEGSNFMLGGGLFILANLSFGCSIVVYNSYLNEIAEPEKRDAVSSIGWAIGYLGGGILLALNLVMYSMSEDFGIDSGHAVRISLASAGLWWGLFTIFPMIKLRSGSKMEGMINASPLTSGFKNLIATFREALKYKQLMTFLIAYLLYNDAVQTVIVVSSQFGSRELGLGMDVLTQVILMVQFVAFLGSLIFNFISNRTSTKSALLISLFIWGLVLIYAYGFLQGTAGFFLLAAVIAIVLGGSQALSRSLYSKLIPQGREAAFFSLYEIGDKGTSWIGPLLFGLALQATGSYRVAILSLIILFVLGILVLLKVNVKKGRLEVNQLKV